jgi:hypothetical protein
MPRYQYELTVQMPLWDSPKAARHSTAPTHCNTSDIPQTSRGDLDSLEPE